MVHRSNSNSISVQERHPREQGLKLFDDNFEWESEDCSRATSTRTRIETYEAHHHHRRQLQVQERHPREQGLKLGIGGLLAVALVTVQERHPREQGLKPGFAILRTLPKEEFKSDIHENKD